MSEDSKGHPSPSPREHRYKEYGHYGAKAYNRPTDVALGLVARGALLLHVLALAEAERQRRASGSILAVAVGASSSCRDVSLVDPVARRLYVHLEPTARREAGRAARIRITYRTF